MSPEDQAEVAYLREALAVLQSALEREESPVELSRLREFIADLENRIDEKLRAA